MVEQQQQEPVRPLPVKQGSDSYHVLNSKYMCTRAININQTIESRV